MNNLARYLIILFIIIGVYSVYATYFSNKNNTEGFENTNKPEEKSEPTCQSCGPNSAKPKLLPILDPLYNMRELCKQSILLEDHLTQERKKCEDCITKHALAIEALAEEACSLDKENKYNKILEPLPDKCRRLQRKYLEGEDPHDVAQEYRQIRKELQPLCYNHF